MNTTLSTEQIDYDRLMQANLSRVFGERDAQRRATAIAELYAENAVMYEPQSIATGHKEISEAVTQVLGQLPPNFVFTATGPAVGHHGLGRLKWAAGPPGGPAAVTGMDVVQVDGGRFQSLHVFLDTPGA